VAERQLQWGVADPMNLIWIIPAEGSSNGIKEWLVKNRFSQAASLRRDAAFCVLC